MRITIQFLAQLRLAAGEASTTIECEEGSTVRAVLRRLAGELGEDFRALALDEAGEPARTLMVAVSGRQVRGGSPGALSDGDELVLGTPIAGG